MGGGANVRYRAGAVRPSVGPVDLGQAWSYTLVYGQRRGAALKSLPAVDPRSEDAASVRAYVRACGPIASTKQIDLESGF